MTTADALARSSPRGPPRHCAAPATTAPTLDPAGSAGVVAASPPSVCGPKGPAPTSASTATPCPSPPACAAGDDDRAPGSQPAPRHVFVASPGPARPALTAARSGPRPPDGRKARCATPATTPPSADGEGARAAVPRGGWCHRRVPVPPAAVTARDWPPCTPARRAGAKTSFMNGDAAIDAHSHGELPKR